MKRKLWLLVLAAAGIAGGFAWFGGDDVAEPQVRTAAITRGAIVETVQATGAIQPVTTVNVGSQVSGVVTWIGADFNTVVRKGQVIARLDPSSLQAQLDQARANLTKVRADVAQRTLSLADKRAKLERAARLNDQGLISENEFETAKLAFAMAETDITSIQAQVVQAQAAVNQAQVNVNHTTISAPIDGTVIQRSVDVGQTVAASLSAPTLFLIAADLTKMEVNASVDEGDISRIRPGQPVVVQVDAHKDARFTGVVAQVRLQPQVVSNVTTYTTIVDVGNAEGKLLPGMTANVTIEVDARHDVLRVPNAALRFRPSAEILAALGQASTPATSGRENAPVQTPTVVRTRLERAATPGVERAARRPGAEPGAGTRVEVWVLDDGVLRAIPVRVGLSDGTQTEVLTGDVVEGAAVVTTITLATAATAGAPATNPFATQPSGRGR